MKTSRFKFEYRKNASQLHREVGDCLRNSTIFSGYQIYQEYPLQKIVPSESGRLHFDWIIPALKLVIEVHGEGHYIPINWGGISNEEAIENFHDGLRRDKLKKEAVLQVGWSYLVIPYTLLGKITETLLFELVQNAEKLEEVPILKDMKKLEAKEYQKQQYQKYKEWKKRKEDYES